MSFEKARDLLRLADMVMSRHMGVSLAEIEEAFGVSRRTAQRMTRALTDAFPLSVEVVAPKALPDLVHPARRRDFDALP